MHWLKSLIWALGLKWFCPAPIDGNWTARSCIKAGTCGCDNKRR